MTPFRGCGIKLVWYSLWGTHENAVRHRVPKVALVIIPPWLEKLTSSGVSRSEIAVWWGAIAGTIALGWNILRATCSKGRVKIEAIYKADGTKPFSSPVFAVQVTNVGSKPILVQGIAIQMKKGSVPSHHFFPCERPMMLAHDMFFLQVIDRTGWLPTGAEKLYAWDSSGKHWYLSGREFRWLIDRHRRFVAAESKRAVTASPHY